MSKLYITRREHFKTSENYRRQTILARATDPAFDQLSSRGGALMTYAFIASRKGTRYHFTFMTASAVGSLKGKIEFRDKSGHL